MIKKAAFFLVCISYVLLFNQCNKKTAAEQFASTVNMQCPARTDVGTVMVSAEAIENTLVLNYTTDFDADYYNNLLKSESFRNSNLYNITTNPELKSLKDAFTTFIHRYRNKENELLAEIKYSPLDYLYYTPEENVDIYDELTLNVVQTMPVLPMTIADGVFIIDMKVEKPAVLEYTVQITFADATEAEVVFNRSLMITHLRQLGVLAKWRDYGVVFRFKVLDKNERVMSVVELGPEDYNSIFD